MTVLRYVMSGTRHKSMEATRLRKENQVNNKDNRHKFLAVSLWMMIV